jgi:hypothetical protein
VGTVRRNRKSKIPFTLADMDMDFVVSAQCTESDLEINAEMRSIGVEQCHK